MPQIPSLPINEPVAQPKAKPGLFGSAGEAVAELGQQTEQIALGNLAFEGHLIEAQRTLKIKQIEIQIKQLESQAHDELSRAVTPEDAQVVHEHFKEQVNNALGPHMGDKALARHLGIYGQQVDVMMQNTVNAKKASIIQGGDEVANKTFLEDSVREGINNRVGGSTDAGIRAALDAKLDSSVHIIGSMLPQEKEAIMQKYDREVEKGVAVAGYNSPDPAKRQYTIKQLADGKDFPHLDKATLNALHTEAEFKDRELNNLAESQNLNGALNATHDAFQTAPFKDNYDLQLSALEDGDWLRTHGIATPNGQPDRVMAAKLSEDINRQRVYHDRAQKEKDEGILEKYSPMVDGHQLTIPQIDRLMQTEGASSRAVGALKSMYYHALREARADARLDKAEARADRQEKRQALEERSAQTSDKLWTRIKNGETLDLTTDVYEQVTKGNLTKGDKAEIIRGYEKSKTSEDFNYGVAVIDKSPLDISTKAKLKNEFTAKVHEENTKPDDMVGVAQKMVEQAGKTKVDKVLDTLWQGLSHPFTPPAPPTPRPPAPPAPKPSSSPKEGDTKQHQGATYKFDGTQWVKQ